MRRRECNGDVMGGEEGGRDIVQLLCVYNRKVTFLTDCVGPEVEGACLAPPTG